MSSTLSCRRSNSSMNLSRTPSTSVRSAYLVRSNSLRPCVLSSERSPSGGGPGTPRDVEPLGPVPFPVAGLGGGGGGVPVPVPVPVHVVGGPGG